MLSFTASIKKKRINYSMVQITYQSELLQQDVELRYFSYLPFYDVVIYLKDSFLITILYKRDNQGLTLG